MTRKRVLVTEKIADEGLDILRRKGYEVDVRLDLAPEALAAAIAPYDALIVRSQTQVTPELLDAAGSLKIIGRAGVTIDNIDVEAASERGVIVCNAPTSNIVSAAEHAMALLLACARRLPQANASMHAGSWERAAFTGTELYQKTLAIFGLGRIGGLVAERARGFGMRLVGHDPYCSPERAAALGVELFDSVEEILPLADFITVHLPKTAETMGLFGPSELAAMKDGVILVNCARGGIFDVAAMADFVAAGKVAAVGLDVFEEEPCRESPLHEFPNALLTPHIAAVTKEAQVRAGSQIAEYVWEGLEGSIVPTAINPTSIPPEVIGGVRPYIPAARIAGRMIQSLIGIPKQVSVWLEGNISDSDPAPIVAGVVDGILDYKSIGTVSLENAMTMAGRHGMDVVTEASKDAQGYESAIRIKADDMDISFTLYGLDNLPRVISFNGYRIDITPASLSLIFEYVDSPGRIGLIGSILGAAGVNITTMQIGTKPEEKCALVYINVEGDITPEVMEELEGAMDYKNLWKLAI